MSDTKKVESGARGRGRPRAFDAEQALEQAQALFHARGYDAVSVSDLTGALGINPPSFYAAFGSKADLYARALERYARNDGLDFNGLLAPDRPLAEGLATLLEQAAAQYAAHGEATGCMVIEGARGSDPVARGTACTMWKQSRETVRAAIARSAPAIAPAIADRLTDHVMASLAGLSASAREGIGGERLRGIAAISAQGMAAFLADSAGA